LVLQSLASVNDPQGPCQRRVFSIFVCYCNALGDNAALPGAPLGRWRQIKVYVFYTIAFFCGRDRLRALDRRKA
jgi:hypothetical protein